jgi:hypothetical protein
MAWKKAYSVYFVDQPNPSSPHPTLHPISPVLNVLKRESVNLTKRKTATS